MSIQLNYNNKQKILTVYVDGSLTIEDFESTMHMMLQSTVFPCDVNALWDIRDMQFENIDISFLKKAVEIQRSHTEKRGRAKIAIVSNYALAAPIIKMYLILSKKLMQTYKSFKSVEEAELWLTDGL